jgi:hypothetical protein
MSAALSFAAAVNATYVLKGSARRTQQAAAAVLGVGECTLCLWMYDIRMTYGQLAVLELINCYVWCAGTLANATDNPEAKCGRSSSLSRQWWLSSGERLAVMKFHGYVMAK